MFTNYSKQKIIFRQDAKVGKYILRQVLKLVLESIQHIICCIFKRTINRLAIDDVDFFNEENQNPKEFKQMKLLLPDHETSFGTIENFMLVKPRCQSQVPVGFNKMEEFDYNTFVYYKVHNGRESRAKAKEICENQGLVKFTEF